MDGRGLHHEHLRSIWRDVLALCTGMRPVVMIDYGGKMPELQDRLLSLLELIQEGLPVFKDLKVMVIEARKEKNAVKGRERAALEAKRRSLSQD